MSNIIDSIQLSGVTYDIVGSGGGGIPESAFTAYTAATDSRISEDEEVTAAALNELNEAISGVSGNNVVELTQAEYDALVDKDPTAFYIITDATAVDLTQYWTSAQTQSAITSATSALNGVVTAHTANANIHVTADEKSDWNAKANMDDDLDSWIGEQGYTKKDDDLWSWIYNEGFVQKDEDLESWIGEQGYTKMDDDLRQWIYEEGFVSQGDLEETLYNYVQTSAITSAVTSASTNSQIPSAKAVYDAIQEGGGGGTVDQTIISGSTNAVAGGAVYDKFDEVEQVTAAALNNINDRLSEDEEVTAAGLNAVNEAVSGKQATLVSGTNIKTINNESLLGSGNIDIQGGGKAIEAGTNISVTTGATADTINCTLPISVGNSNTLISIGNGSNKNIAFGQDNTFGGTNANCLVGGRNCKIGWNVSQAVALGYASSANSTYSTAIGIYVKTSNNNGESTFGKYNVSNTGSTDAYKTLFSVGNGTDNNARHNAFEIRQNGDIYLSSGGTDIKLQDHLGGGGGGSTYTAGDGINITNNVISVTGKADTSAVTAIQDSLSGYVTTDTEQTISRKKIFTYSASSGKAIEFKQTSDSAKVGFSVKNSASTNNEVASFEFRPNTFTIDNVQHPLMYFGHYRNTNTANAGVPQTVIGFRQYDQLNAAAYHYLLPLPEKAKTPFSLTTSFKDYYAPIGFKNGSTMITTDNTGVADFSNILGGLKLVKLTQVEYDLLTTKDDNTVYFIGDSNGYIMKIGSANVSM